MIEKTTLKNGLTVITDYVPWVQSVSFGMWIGAGSICETDTNNGAAHFFEHMAFKGTPTRDARQVSLDIEQVGGYTNAYTSREVTAYYGKVLSSDLGILADVISDMLQNSLLDGQEMERERTVILQELMQSIDTPDDIIFDYFQSAVFQGTSLARPILGTEETIKALTPDMLREFLNTYYGPKNTVVVASGHVKHEDHVRLIGQLYVQSGADVSVEHMACPQYGGMHQHQRDGLRQAQLIWGYQAPKRGTHESRAMRIANIVLSGGMSSRLMHEVREKLGLVYTINSFYHTFDQTGLWGIYAGTSPQKVREVINKSLEQLYDLAEHGPRAEEMDQARKQIQAQTRMVWESVGSRARLLGEHYTHHREILDLDKELEKLCAITPNHVQEVVQYLIQQKASLSVLSNGAVMPTDADLKAWRVST